MSSVNAPSAKTKRLMAEALNSVGYEVLPFASAEDKVVESVPTSISLTVTASPSKGMDATIDLASRLAARGYSVAPHLSAKMIRDAAELRDIESRLNDSGIRSIFVVGGDASEPAGEFSEALEVLHALDRIGHHFDDIGIGGYPEGHPSIPDAQLESALGAKAPLANHITTQICFNAETISRWALGLAAKGVTLPVRVGLPGAVSRAKLMRVTAGIGLGESARFLKHQQNMFWRFFVPGGYSPTKLVTGLRPALADDSSPIVGFHLFTFNDVAGTEEWRQTMLARFS